MTDRLPSIRWLFAYAGVCLVYVGLSFVGLSPFAQMVLRFPLYLALPAVAAVSAFSARRSSRAHGRRVWLLTTCALTLLCLGEVVRASYRLMIDPAGPKGLSLADVGFGPGYLLLAVSIALLALDRFGAVPRLARLRHAADGLIMLAIALAFLWQATIRPMVTATGGADPSGILHAGYAVVDVLMLAVVVGAAMALERPQWHRWEVLVAAGFATLALGDAVSGMLGGSAGVRAGGLAADAFDLARMTSYLMFAIGARAYIADPHPEGEARHLSTGAVRYTDYVPSVLAALLIPRFMWIARANVANASEYWLWVGFATLLAALIIGRSAVVSVTNRELAARAVADGLTGLFNHRFFHERAGVEVDRARRSGEPVAILLIDLDDFREVNEAGGHLAGDRQLQEVARVIADGVREADVPCRIGGDEFAVILPEADAVEAYKIWVRISASFRNLKMPGGAYLTGSAGIAAFPEHAEDKDQLLRSADDAQYAAKDGGRDRAVIFDPALAQSGRHRDQGDAERRALLRTMRCLAAAVDVRDEYTHSHSLSVALMCSEVARRMGMDAEQMRTLEAAALLHDVGKIGVSDSILRKPGVLTPEEYELIKTHPALGQQILRGAVEEEILTLVLHHHERWDGLGYPLGVEADQIPAGARIIAVCDAYHAMTSDRAYRSGMSHEAAVAEMVSCSGTQFDPEVVEAFRLVYGEQAPVLGPVA